MFEMIAIALVLPLLLMCLVTWSAARRLEPELEAPVGSQRPVAPGPRS